MNTLNPGLVGSFFIFFFGIFACLIFACAQTSHGANFPVNSIFIYFAVGFNRCSPVCGYQTSFLPSSIHLPSFFHGFCEAEEVMV